MTAAKGLPVWHSGWPDGTYAEPEITSGGVALLDFDNDGRLDILQICHGRPGHFDDLVPNHLFHQRPNGTFEEVPNAGGIVGRGYAMGVAIGDYNNDGRPDVFITRLGHNSLYRNNGDGTFTDVTAEAGLATARPYWSTSAAWVDYDRDGWLDLFVAHFGDFDPSQACFAEDGRREYCGPETLQGMVASLYHNNRDGTFTEVTKQAGITSAGRGWGVVCADLTGDGWPDIFVANDEQRQSLWVNQHDGTFKDEALERGVALSGAGNPEAGMGVGIGDVANDGNLSLFITHVWGEKNTLYAPAGKGFFSDVSATAGMAAAGLTHTGWGCGLADFDNDGNLDLAIVNGRVRRGPIAPDAKLGKFWDAYAEKNLLFRGDGAGHFTIATARGGDFIRRAQCTRGLAFGDFDNDGRIDLVTNSLDNTLRLYHNVAPQRGNHWLLVRALAGDRDAVGARIRVTSGKQMWTRLILSSYSYLSSSDPRAHFGLGNIDHIDSLEVDWPDGRTESFDAPAVDRQATLRQGEGYRSAARETPAARTPAASPSATDKRERNFAALLDAADAYAESGDSPRAMEHYREAIAAAPERSEGYAHRADALVATGALSDALKDYRMSLRIAPEDGSLYLKRAKTLMLLERLEMAQSDCDDAIKFRPKWGEAYLVRGNIRLQRHDLDAAIADFDVAIRFMENPASPYNNRGVAHLQKGEIDLALADYTAALEHSREFADAYNNRGDLFARRGKLDAAVADFSESIRIAPLALRAYENRGDVYLRKSQPDKARADYTTIIERTLAKSGKGNSELQPGAKLGRIYRKRAAAWLALNRLNDALSDVNEAIDLNPDDAESVMLRRQVNLRKGQFREAEKDEQRATQIQLRQLSRPSR